jgi:hypothetical protein
MLNQRRCCHCGNGGPFVRVATCQDGLGDVLGFLCLCAAYEADPSPGAFLDRILDHIAGRIAVRRLQSPRLPPRYRLKSSPTGH